MNEGLEFDKTEMEKLIKLLFCGDMIINGSKLTNDKETREYRKLTQKIFKKAYDMGMTDIIKIYFNNDIDIDNDLTMKYYEEFFTGKVEILDNEDYF